MSFGKPEETPLSVKNVVILQYNIIVNQESIL